jgi:addiction module HigA family antidote
MKTKKSKKPKHPHPGLILLHEFMLPYDMSESWLAIELDIPERIIKKIIAGEHDIDIKIAQQLSSVMGTNNKFWLGLQADYDKKGKK